MRRNDVTTPKRLISSCARSMSGRKHDGTKCKTTHAVILLVDDFKACGGGRVVRWCWVNFQCRGVLLIWIIVGQGPTVLEVGAGGGCLDIFSLIYHFSFLFPFFWETARYRLKYCLKGPLGPKQPTNHQSLHKKHQRYNLDKFLLSV